MRDTNRKQKVTGERERGKEEREISSSSFSIVQIVKKII